MPTPTTSDIAKAKTVILGILQESGGAFCGKTRLFKAFYLAHLYHFKSRQGVLSDYPIVRMPLGPGIESSESLFESLIADGLLHLGARSNGPYVEEVFTLLNNTPVSLTEDELASIREALNFVENLSGTEVSRRMHEYSKSWRSTAPGREMNIYADLLSDDDYNQMEIRQAEVAGRIDAALERRKSQ